jgi:hypothetical protein
MNGKKSDLPFRPGGSEIPDFDLFSGYIESKNFALECPWRVAPGLL